LSPPSHPPRPFILHGRLRYHPILILYLFPTLSLSSIKPIGFDNAHYPTTDPMAVFSPSPLSFIDFYRPNGIFHAAVLIHFAKLDTSRNSTIVLSSYPSTSSLKFRRHYRSNHPLSYGHPIAHSLFDRSIIRSSSVSGRNSLLCG
jgi:hypothetical protein